MTERSPSRRRAFLLAALLCAAGCSGAGGPGRADPAAPAVRAGADGFALRSRDALPDFDPADFAAGVPNPWFPLDPGTSYTYVSETDEGTETTRVEVTAETKTILGVRTTVVRDRVFLDGALIEDTFDWYAPDDRGNIWYFGEDTKEYDNGTPVSTAGSWEAGVNGARPGIIMLAHPRIGDTYQQEDFPGVVEDRARVLSLRETVTVPFGTFAPCLETMDWTPLEPGHREFKYYASGVGVVLELSPRGGRERVELTGFARP